MKVTHNSSPAANSNPAALNPAQASASRPGAGRSGVLASAAGDAASFGAATVGLSARALAQPDVRSGLVDHFRAQLAAGNYHPDPGDIAASMLGDPLTHL